MSSDTRRLEIVRVEADIALARERVARDVRVLRRELHRRTDWHEWVARRPGTFVMAAFAVGFLLGRRR